MQTFSEIIESIDNFVWGWFLIVLILGVGLFISIRTKFFQVRKFPQAFSKTIVPTIKGLGKKNKVKGDGVSGFEAFATAISGTVGTGNIIGVTSAILSGGPGAVFWMWVSAFFGMVTNYAESVLALFFRKKDANGEFKGGAFYYLENGLKWKKFGKILAYLAGVFCMLAAVGMSGVQTNKITGTITSAINFNELWVKLLIGGILALVLALIILGGIKRIGKVASYCVPFMSILFIVLAVVAILINASKIPAAVSLIFSNIFSFKAAAGGIGGFAFSKIIKMGMARGVFSNEAGLGSSVIAHAASNEKEPVKQGLWGVFGVFFDTFIICSLTAFMILTVFDITAFSGKEIDATLAITAFTNTFGTFGTVCFSIILPMFAFTTILAWAYYGEKAVEYCFSPLGVKGEKISVLVFKIIYVLLTFGSAVLSSDIIWNISDIANGLMAVPNLVALIFLSGTVCKITKNYYDRQNGKHLTPMLSAYEDLNNEFTKETESKTQERFQKNETEQKN